MSEKPEELGMNTFLVRAKKPDGERRWVCQGYAVDQDLVFLSTVDDGMVVINLNAVEDLTIEAVTIPA